MPRSAARETAIAAGEKRYQGGPCIKCGLTEKYVSSSSCTFCTTKSTVNRSSDIWRRYRKSERGRERLKEYKKTEAFKENQNRYRRKKYKEDKAAFRKRELKKYGLTIDAYALMLEQQGHKCASCDTPKENFKKALAVDHCHKTGRVRGLLCLPCNTSLGLLKESTEKMQKLMNYMVVRCV